MEILIDEIKSKIAGLNSAWGIESQMRIKSEITELISNSGVYELDYGFDIDIIIKDDIDDVNYDYSEKEIFHIFGFEFALISINSYEKGVIAVDGEILPVDFSKTVEQIELYLSQLFDCDLSNQIQESILIAIHEIQPVTLLDWYHIINNVKQDCMTCFYEIRSNIASVMRGTSGNCLNKHETIILKDCIIQDGASFMDCEMIVNQVNNRFDLDCSYDVVDNELYLFLHP